LTDRTNAERQARYAARVREQGLVKICEWIPADCRDTLKRIAAELRGDAPEPMGECPEVANNQLHSQQFANNQLHKNHPLAEKERYRVQQAHGWGWTPDAIAAYVGIEVAAVKRILGEK